MLTIVSFSIFIALLIWFGVYIASRLDRNARFFLVILFLGGFIFRLLMLFTTYVILVEFLPEEEGFLTGADNDESKYHKAGQAIAQAWKKGIEFNPTVVGLGGVPAIGYSYFNAIVYFLLGDYSLLIRIFNSFLGSLTPLLVYMIGKSVCGHQIAKTASILTSFLPSQLFYTISQMKEAFVLFSSITAIYGAIRLRKKFTLPWFSLVVLMVLLLISVRFTYALVLFMALSLYFLKSNAIANRLRVGFGLAFLAALVGFAVVRFGYGRLFAPLAQLDLSPIYLNAGYSHDVTRPKSGSFYTVFAGDYALHTIPLAILYNLGAPFPVWFVNFEFKFSQWLLWLGSVVWYMLIPFTCYGFRTSLRNRNDGNFLLVVYLIGMLLLFGVSRQGLTSAGRHKETLMPLFMIFAGAGITNYKRDRYGIDMMLAAYFLMAYGLILLYVYVKLSFLLSALIFSTGCITFLSFIIAYFIRKLSITPLQKLDNELQQGE